MDDTTKTDAVVTNDANPVVTEVVENGAITDLTDGYKVQLATADPQPVDTTSAPIDEHPAHSVLRDMENEIHALGSYALTVLRPFLEKIRNAL